ncbi:complex I 24 kDa subunit family protein [Thermodesulfovibrio yellowstonii]|uniref:NADH-quinone oxidoreductase subunit NuoE family protein n=1 Tax=Thermodesulfovibrio yellowstonii TaxID=28262 RepID=UPI0024B353F3|nr:NAD(P)H-dependent oxidoreductase subunit E [Thermodesulfovibrio yellowstonii]MDI6864821.1 NAD(P)H-dependent oxidoreductase subunit E [Thermodesulfovibrio yellowstonii]
MDKLDRIISIYSENSGRVLGILEEIQKDNGYLPKEQLLYLSKKLKIPFAQLYSIATFYSFFEVQPIGKHVITVCQGTACHVKGCLRILNGLVKLLGITQEQLSYTGRISITTPDRLFTINTARCFGACSMAPIIKVDNEIYGNNTVQKLPYILKKYGWTKDENQNS